MKKEESREKRLNKKIFSAQPRLHKDSSKSDDDEHNSSSDERRDRVQSLREGREIQGNVG